VKLIPNVLTLAKFVPTSLVTKLSRQSLVFKKNSPTIFFVAGVVGTAASTFLACRATMRLADTVTEIEEDLNAVKELRNNPVENSNYLPEEWRRDTAYVYVKSTLKLVKLYAPATIVGVVSIGLLTTSHVQLNRRNEALMAAYAVLQDAYENYRERVRNNLGEARELELYHSARSEVVKDELGHKTEVVRADPNTWSPYAKFFDEGSRHWVQNPEYNRMFIQCQQNHVNDLLTVRGHVFLNECYDLLDIPRTKAGSVVGWVMGGEGDNYITFGIYKAFNARFVNGDEPNIILDFNVDGVIYDQLGEDNGH